MFCMKIWTFYDMPQWVDPSITSKFYGKRQYLIKNVNIYKKASKFIKKHQNLMFCIKIGPFYDMPQYFYVSSKNFMEVIKSFYAKHQNLADHFHVSYKNTFLNFGPNYSTGMKLQTSIKGYCSTKLVCQGTSMVFTSFTRGHFQPLLTFGHSW